jgi:phosphoribosylanthranilate isomerase
VGSVILSEQEWKNPLIYDTIRTVENSSSKSSLIPLFSDRDAVFRTLGYYQPDIVHFCENLYAPDQPIHILDRMIDLQHQIREQFPSIQIMRSIPIAEPEKQSDFSIWKMVELFEPVSDYFLTDTILGDAVGGAAPEQPVSGFVGITGRTCDWSVAAALVKKSSIPVILAGGLTPDNVVQGIRQASPAGVDSCTGTNLRDAAGKPVRFRKDIKRLKDFISRVRSLERQVTGDEI